MDKSVINKKLVLQAINAVRELNLKHAETAQKISLMDDENKLYLQITMKKIPKTKTIKLIKVPLPHTFLKNTAEVCLITGDLNKKNRKAALEPDVLHYKELLKEKGVENISEVMTLRQLRTEYKPYEAKQKLLAAFDMFLADDKICQCLPKILGKHFFRKRKYPVQVDLRSANLKDRVKNILSSSMIYITGHGNSCTCEVASLQMNDLEVVENIVSAGKTISQKLPGSWDNVMGLYLKTAKSKAVPIYMSFDDPNSIDTGDKEEKIEFCVDELSTVPNAKVKVYTDGRVETIRTWDDFKGKHYNPDQNSEPAGDAVDSQNSDEEDKKLAKKSKIISDVIDDTSSIPELKSQTSPSKSKAKKKKGPSFVTGMDSCDIFEKSEIEEKEEERKLPRIISEVVDMVSNDELQSKKTPKGGKKKSRKSLKSLAVEEVASWDNVKKVEIEDEKEEKPLAKDSRIIFETLHTVSAGKLKLEETPNDAKKNRRRRRSSKNLPVKEIGSCDSVEKSEIQDYEEERKLAKNCGIVSEVLDIVSTEETPKDAKKKKRKSLVVKVGSLDGVEKSEIQDEKEVRKLAKNSKIISEVLDTVSTDELISKATPKDAKKRRRRKRSSNSLSVEVGSQDSVEESEIQDEKEERKLVKNSRIISEVLDTISPDELISEATPKDAKKKRMRKRSSNSLAVEDSDIKVLRSSKKLRNQKIESVNKSPCATPNSVSKKRKRNFQSKN